MKLRCLVALVVFAVSAYADEGFLRIRRNEAGEPEALETAIVRLAAPVAFSGEKRFTVDLISAVHVAEPDYYDILNKEFTKYDAVLYELIADDEVKPDPEASPDNPVSLLQTIVTQALGLEFQLKGISYRPTNMVHADMSPTEFARSMKERNESFAQLFLKVWLVSAAKDLGAGSGRPPDLKSLLLIASNRSRALALRRVFAEQFANVDELVATINGKEGSTLVTERNKTCIGKLREQIVKKGHRFAIFYGAAHMPDFKKQLVKEFSIDEVDRRWVVAWNLEDSAELEE